MQYFVQTVVNALSLGSLYALLALGIAIVFSVMGLINFAHGALLTLSAYAVYLLVGYGIWVWAPVAVIVGAAASIIIERVAFRPLRGIDMTSLLVASYAVAMSIQAIVQMFSGSVPRTPALPPFFTESVNIAGQSISNLSLIAIGISTVVVLALVWFFRRTRYGIQMRAAAINFDMARLVGINSNRVISLAFLISGVLAGISGVLLLIQSGSATPQMGFQPAIIGFIAVVIGGMGSITGAAVGGLLLGAATVFLQAFLPPELVGYRDGLIYLAVFLMLLFRPRGLFGTVARKA